MTTEPRENLINVLGRHVDFGRTASDYRRFRAGFPQEFFDVLLERNWIRPGLRALDIGTGTGTVARGLAAMGLLVFAVDRSAELIEQAKQISNEANLQIEYRQASAEALPYPDSSFDVVTAGQCWHWFDRPQAALEAARVLVPGGRVIIAHFNWLPLPGNIVDATESLILAHNPNWALAGGTGLFPQWLKDLGIAGFQNLETLSFDIMQPYSHEAWRGRIRASAGVQASLTDEQTARFDAEHAELLRTRFPNEPLLVPHRVWIATGVRP